MRSRPLLAGGSIGAAMLLCVALPAAAHPHVYVDSGFAMQFDARGLAALRVVWVFDPMYSSMVLNDFDRDRNKIFSPTETRQVERRNFGVAKTFNYFLRVVLDGGEPLKFDEVRDFEVKHLDGRVAYLFTLPLAAPGPGRRIDVSIFDPEYYVGYTTQAASVRTEQPPPGLSARCEMRVETVEVVTYGFPSRVDMDVAACVVEAKPQ